MFNVINNKLSVFLPENICVENGQKWHCQEDACYAFFPDEGVSKSEADDKCGGFGGHVLALETTEERDSVVEIINKHGTVLGLEQNTPNPTIKSLNFSVSYTNWRPL